MSGVATEAVTGVGSGVGEDSAVWRIGRAADVPVLEGRSVVVGGRRIAVFNTGAGFAAIDADCPHRGGPLSDGIVADGCVTCPLHEWRVDLRSGEVVGGGEGAVRSYEVVERDGELLISVPVGDLFSDSENNSTTAEVSS